MNKPDTSKLKISFAKSSTSSKVSAMSAFPVGRKVCYAVNVSGEAIEETPKSSCSPALGQFSSFVPDGGTVSLEVKKGNARTIEVFAYLFDTGTNGECPAWTPETVSTLNYMRVFSVGKSAPVDLLNSEENVAIDASFPGLTHDLATDSGMTTASCANLSPAGGAGPTVTLTSSAPNPTNSSAIPVTATFSASVTGVMASDFVTNGTISSFTGTGTTYTFSVIPSSDGTITIDLPAGVATDGSGNANSAATQLSRVSDRTPPGTTTIAGVTGGTDSTANAWLTNGVFPTANWSDVTGESGYVVKIRDSSGTSDVCSAVTAAQDATSHSFTGCTLIEGTAYKISVSAVDAAGNAAVASNDLYDFTVDSTAPTVSTFSVTSSNPTSSTTFTLSSSVTGTYSDYCILQNSTSLASCTWTSGALPSSYTVTSTDEAKVLSVWTKDAAGNVSARVDAASVTLDTTGPSAPSALALQSPATSPSNDLTPTIRVSGVTSGDTVKMFTDSSCTAEVASGVATGSTIDLTSSTLAASTYTFYAKAFDPLSNASACSGASVSYTVNLTAPAVLNVSSSTTNGTYGVGQTIAVTVQFSEAVTVTGTPTLTLETGATDRTVNYSSGSGTDTLTFTYTVQAGDTSADLDYVATTPLALNAGTIIGNTTANNADLTLPTPGAPSSLGANKALAIDSTPPAPFSISGAKGSVDTTADAWLTAGSNVTIAWGASSGAGSYDVTIRDSTNSTDVCSVQNTTSTFYAFSSCPLTEGATYKALVVAKDDAGNTTAATNDAFAFTVDTTAPVSFTVTGATGNSADLTANEWLTDASSPVTANWNDTTGETGYAVTIRDAAETTDVCATVTLSANVTSHTFSACPMIEGTTYVIEVRATDDAGHQTAATKAFTIDSLAPSFTAFSITNASPTNTTTYSLNFTASGTPSSYCILENDTAVGNCTWTATPLPTTFTVGATDGTKTLSAWLKDAAGNVSTRNDSAGVVLDTAPPSTPTAVTLQNPSTSPGNVTTPTVTVSGMTSGDTAYIYSDAGCTSQLGSAVAAGTSVNVTSSTVSGTTTIYAKARDAAGNFSSSCSSGVSYTLDTTAPTVINVTASTSDGSFTIGSSVVVTVQFSEAVTVTGGTPQLTLEMGVDQNAAYNSGSGTDTLSFTYTIQAGDTSTDLDYVSATSLALNGATIKDSATNSATLTLPTPGGANSLGANKAIVIDTTAPAAFGITGATGNTDITADAYLTYTYVTANWGASTGASSYDVTIRNSIDSADVCSIQNTTSTFYSFSSCLLTDGTYYRIKVIAKDAAGNQTAATNNLFSFSVDTTAPVLASVSITNTSPTSTTVYSLSYGSVTGTYAKYCILQNLNTVGSCGWTLGTLPASFTVSATNQANVLSVWLKDAAGNVSARVDSNSVTLDTVAPSIPSGLTLFSPATSPGNDTTPTITVSGVVASDTVTLYTDSSCTTSVGSMTSTAATVDVTTGALGPDGNYTFYAKNVDMAGNSSACSTANVSYQLDTSVPTVSSVSSTTTDGDYAVGGIITLNVNFSANVTVSGGPPTLLLETGTTDRTATYTGGSGTSTLNFTYTVQAGDTSSDLEYQSQSAISLNGATIKNAAGTNATLNLPSMGAAGSLGANKAIVIDTTAPGSFVVLGITGGADSTQDNALTSGYYATLNWSGSSGAASFDVGIRNAADTADVCSAVNVSYLTTSHSFSSCSLAGGGSYTAKVVAKDAAGNATPVTYGFTVASPDITPNTFTFTHSTNNTLSSLISSQVVQISGISATASVSITGGSFRICADIICSANPTFTTTGSISNNQYLQLQTTSSASWSTMVSVAVTVGDTAVSWNVTTSDDNTPNSFFFTSVTEPPFTDVVSNIVQINGITGTSTMVSVTGPGSPQFQICSDAGCGTIVSSWGSTSASISNGQYIQVRTETPGYYNGSANVTVTVGSMPATWVVSSSAHPPGGFVLTSAAWTGNLGGLAGANTKCLTDLTTYNWFGKSAFGTLSTTNVRAFLCDGISCNNLAPNMPYTYARSNSAIDGGATFNTDGTGSGPNDSTTWSHATVFNASSTIWTGRGSISPTLWSSSSDSNHCSAWTSGTNGVNGNYGNVISSTATRWTNGTGAGCGTTRNLICIVDPPQGSPKAFKFNDVTGAAFSTLISSNIVQMRMPENLTLSITGGSYRVCSDSACSGVITTWSTAPTTLYDSQYVQLKTTSPASTGSVSVAVNIGSASSIWTVETSGMNGAWSPINSNGAPSPRKKHISVWTGSEMIVFGGESGSGGADVKSDGARYNPTSDTWGPMASGGTMTEARAVYSGTEVLVWGGYTNSVGSKTYSAYGGRYNPSTDTWTDMSATGAPTARIGHTAIWTGTELIVWGGYGGTGYVLTGSRYNPSTDTWTTISPTNGPTARAYHTAVWTGTDMIVYGGYNGTSALSDAYMWNPTTGWSTLSAGPLAMKEHAAAYGGGTMFVRGSSHVRYNTGSSTWFTVTATNAPSANSNSTVVWTGTRFVSFGGSSSGSSWFNDFGSFDPSGNAWDLNLSRAGMPGARDSHTAVWTGTKMLIWGGFNGSNYLGNGAGFTP